MNIFGFKREEVVIGIVWFLFLYSLNAGSISIVENECGSMEVIGENLTQLENLKHCEVINGSVILSRLPANITKYSLSVREITGYLLLYRVEFLESLEKLLPNLTLIRGEYQFEGNSLIIYENIGLLDLGLINLMRIKKGSIRISRNPQLCYVQTVNWLDIISDIDTQNLVIRSNNGDQHCGTCSNLNSIEALNVYSDHFCWKHDVYQKVCESYRGDCCADGCLSSCIWENENELTNGCAVCEDVKDRHGQCFRKCPPNLVEHQNRMCITDIYCRSLQLIPYNGTCLRTCPDGYQLGKGDWGDFLECQVCSPYPCDTICDNSYTVESEEDAKQLINCTYITGSLEIEIKPKNTQIIQLLESHLSKIKKIGAYLKITQSPQLTTLFFFKNLQTISGNDLYEDKYSLYVADNFNLEHLWNHNQNVTLERGTAFFHLNPKICLLNITNSLVINSKIKIDGGSDISNGYESYCNLQTYETIVEDVNATAARIKVDKFLESHIHFIFLAYFYYYKEAPNKNVTNFDNFHGCGHDNWQIQISPGINVRYVINNLKPRTQYAYFVRSFTITNTYLKLNEISNVGYFTTTGIKEAPSPVTKFFFKVLNSTSIELH